MEGPTKMKTEQACYSSFHVVVDDENDDDNDMMIIMMMT
jgi:hypothetical protein